MKCWFVSLTIVCKQLDGHLFIAGAVDAVSDAVEVLDGRREAEDGNEGRRDCQLEKKSKLNESSNSYTKHNFNRVKVISEYLIYKITAGSFISDIRFGTGDLNWTRYLGEWFKNL